MGKSGFFPFTAAYILLLTLQSIYPAKVSAQNENWSVSAANWMQYWYFRYGDQSFLEARRDSLDNRFIVDFDLGDFYTGAWLKVDQYNQPSESSERISQRYFGWRDKNFSIHLGNFYQAFDRGLTLNAFLDDVIYFDNNLDGIRVSGNFDGFDFDALSARGLNSLTDQREYTLRGMRGAVRPIRPARVGFSYVRFKQSSSDFFRTLNANLSSVNSGFSYGPLDLYAEYARKIGRADSLLPSLNLDGDGTYLSASVSFEKFSLYSEYKNYINLLYPVGSAPFNNPPPASREGRTLMSLSADPGERGYQIGTLISPTFDLNLDLSFSESFSRGSLDGTTHYLAEKYAGVRWSAMPSLVVNYSWDRFDWTEIDEADNYVDGYYYLSGSHTISLTAYTKRFFNWLAAPGGPAAKDYHENYLVVGYGKGSFLSLNLGGSTSNQMNNPDPDKMAFVELTLRFARNELVIFNGGERGGLICSSGICQTRPTFVGTRIVLYSRF